MQSVLNALRLLEEVAARQPVGVGELSRLLGMPKSSAQRALRTLHTAGWVRPVEGDFTRWVMTAKAGQLGSNLGDLGLREAAMAVMEGLRDRTEETIHLMVPDGLSAVLIERLQTRHAVRIVLPLGISLPLHASANGKAMLAYSPPSVVDQVLEEGLANYTEMTITAREELIAELKDVRSRGFATNNGEWRSDIAAVAAAILAGDKSPVGSISISTPASRMPNPVRAKFGSMVSQAASDVSAAIAANRD